MRTVATPGWTRWLVPPAALAVHLSIGQAYAWSVFKPAIESSLDLTGTESALPFQLGIVMLGLSAAAGGTLVEKRGPRWAMMVAMACWASGFLLAALGMVTEQYWLVVLGYGGVGGVGLGIGYISPVSTLLKWFPDRPGLATGIAIMGFGGGALIASPWSTRMLDTFGRTSSGVAQAFVVHAVVYALAMGFGAALVRVPPSGFRPVGWDPARTKRAPVGPAVAASVAIKTRQFWCLWVVLCANVSAGIGILEKAAPMIADFFAGTSAGAAAGFVALLSLANMAGRLAWSSASDVIGRKNIYRIYLGVGALMYVVLWTLGGTGKLVFVGGAFVILSFYGGGFATIPAYLRDLFGTYQVGAIHGRLLTAWSLAGVLGPLIVNAVADAGHGRGATGPALYAISFPVLVGLLVIGFVANELVRPVDARYHAKLEAAAAASVPATLETPPARARTALTIAAWIAVGVPFAWGVRELVVKVAQLFG